MESRWEYRPDAEPDPDGEVVPRSRRWRLVVGVLLAVVAIGLGVSVILRPVSTLPSPEAGNTDQVELSATPPQPPVPETYEGLKQEALALGRRMRERFPETPETLSLLAMMHHRFGDMEEAMQCWQQWLDEHPNFPEAYFRLGRYAKERGDNAEAVDLLQKAFLLDPTLPGVQVHLGESMMNQGNADEAIRVLEAEIAGIEPSPNQWLLLGHACLQAKQYEKAKQAFSTVIEMDPSSMHAYFGLGTACAKLGHTEESRRHLMEYRNRKSQDVAAYREEMQQDDVLSVRQNVSQWHGMAGMICARKGDLKMAESLWLRGAAILPEETYSRRALVELYGRQGKHLQAARIAAELRSITSRQGSQDDHEGR